ncbi:unnamed protein product [Ceutorhynchus assimilis]|uniref:Heparanase n=1 Tax=Ceutorhynchus assimilis TaxID=467358 RepID=A0A9N9M9M8_9CUCU|nr:unnamed protein product [Ceutorhynchus assimilis]
MWFGINEWFNLASLTPVFAIDDREREKGVWSPEAILPLLEMSDKFGVKCYWQLGYGSCNKTAVQYVEDLNILRQTINDFPEQTESWKIAGSDFSSCDSNNIESHSFDGYIRDLDENLNAIMWKGQTISKGELGLTKASLWTSIPKEYSPVTFSTVLQYAIKVGEAAMLEYDVIFREPRLLELTHVTPVYWFSYFYKKLMGLNVLEIKSTNQNSILHTFTHCTKRQNNLIQNGAITVMAVNNGSETNTANIRLGNFLLEKSMEIQSYFLTASNITNSDVFLNDIKLTMSMLQKPETLLTPELRRTKIRPHIVLQVPPQTIAFFVLTGATYSLCMDNEEDLTDILKDINEDSKATLSHEHPTNIENRRPIDMKSRNNIFNTEKLTLQSIKGNILKEMEQDKFYYNKILGKPHPNTKMLSKTNTNEDNKREILHKHLRAFIEKSKPDISNKSQFPNNRPSVNNLHLTIKEIEDILKRRAREKAAAKNIKLTSSELDLLVDKATLKIPKHFVFKRAINKILLEEKANFHKSNSFTQEMYEEIAKEMKIYPKHKKYRRSQNNRLSKRSINTQLLNLKALAEENKKFSKKYNGKINKSYLKTKRDINLDLLKKRTQSQFDKSKVIVQPNFNRPKSHIWTAGHENEPTSLDDESSHDLFDDIMRFEEKTFKDIEEGRNPLAELDAYDKLFKKSNNRHSSLFENRFYNPFHLDQSNTQPKTGSNLEKFNPMKYLQSLQSRSEEFGQFVHHNQKQTPKFDDKLGHLFAKSKYGQNDKDLREWSALKSVLNGRNEQPESLYGGFDDFNFSGDLDYGFYRKKRNIKTISEAKMRSLKVNIKNEIRKLKMQLKDEKLKYLKQKVSKGIHQKHSKTNVQKIPKYDLIDLVANPDTKNLTLEQILAKADSRENIIEHGIQKRSIMKNEFDNIFGQYTPLTSGLKSWKPADILNLNKNYFTTLPIYSWVQDQNLRLKYEINKNKLLSQLGLRKKRHIDIDDNNKFDFEQNEIVDKELLKEDRENDDKDQWVKGKHIVNVAQVKTKPNSEPTTYSENDHIQLIPNIPTPEKLTYLEKIMGRQNARPVENFFSDIKDKFNTMNKKVKGFFGNLFQG